MTDIRQLPSRVKDSFCNVQHCNYVGVKFDMVNPDETNSTDLIVPGVPNRRLVFAGLNKDSAVLVYEVGSYASFLRASILDFKTGAAWNGNVRDVKNMRDLRTFLAQENHN